MTRSIGLHFSIFFCITRVATCQVAIASLFAVSLVVFVFFFHPLCGRQHITLNACEGERSLNKKKIYIPNNVAFSKFTFRSREIHNAKLSDFPSFYHVNAK